MKTNVLKVCMLCAIMLCTVSASTYAQDDALKKMVGKWTYKMNIPEVGEVDGECNIAITNGEAKATIPTPMGDWVTSPLVLDNGKYAGKVSADFGDIKYLFSWKTSPDVLLMEMSFDAMGAMPPIEMKRAQ